MTSPPSGARNAFLFDELGFEGTTERLRAHQKAGNPEAMASEISDELLDHLAVCGGQPPADMAP